MGKPFLLHWSILAWTFSLLVGVCVSQDQFSPPYANRPITNLAYDSATNSLFIGSRNAIFRTSTSLKQKEYAVTGPVNDTLDGKPYKPRSGFDNHNEILLVLEPGKKLLVCGTGMWGRCAVHNLTQLQQDLNPQTALYLVTSEFTFNQGLVTEVGDNRESVVFIATNFSTNPNTRADRAGVDSYYPISARKTSELIKKVKVFDLQMKKHQLRNDFKMSYRAILKVGKFIYFLFNKNSMHATISKMCLKANSNSYEEIPLSCSDSGMSYPFIQHGEFITVESGQKVLVALFSNFEDHKNPVAKGAICIFSENEILSAFNRSRIHRSDCPPPLVNTNQLIYKDAWVGPQQNCDPSSTKAIFDLLSNLKLCGDPLQVMKNLIGFTPLHGTAVYNSHSQMSAITYRQVNNLPEIFVGTTEGDILKFFVGDDSGMLKLRFLRRLHKVTGTGIVNLKSFAGNIYVASGSTVLKLPEESCANYTTCSGCMRAGAARCGWCVITERCTEANTVQCPSYNPTNKGLWLPSVKGQCTQISFSSKVEEGVSKEDLRSSGKKKFTFQLNPSISTDIFGGQRVCKIGNHQVPITETDAKLSCEFPANTLDLKSNMIKLQVILKGTMVSQKILLFYSCSDYKTCFICLNDPRRDCSWCADKGSCLKNAQECTADNTQATSVQNVSQCPYIESSSVKLAVKQKSDLAFTAHNLISTYTYICSVDGGLKYTADVKQNATALVCKNVGAFNTAEKRKVEFGYEGMSGTHVSVQSLSHDGSKLQLRNSFIEVYECPEVLMRYALYKNDCSTCNYLRTKGYKCQWCGSDCRHACPGTQSQPCGNPNVYQISPINGPFGGNTLLTLSGINLGIQVQDIDYVRVGKSPCTEALYNGRNITCRTGPVNDTTTGSVDISVNGVAHKSSMVRFTYQKANLTKLSPTQGIKQGGTMLTIQGVNLQIGNRDLKIEMVNSQDPSNKKSCHKVNSTDASILCRLMQNSDPQLTKHYIQVTLDGKTTIKLDIPYVYVENPIVRETEPRNLVSLLSGGTMFKVKGERLVIATEKFVMVEGVRRNCYRDEDGVSLQCEFPPKSSSVRSRRKRSADGQISAQPMTMILHLDGWTQAIPDDNRGVTYVSDPVLNNLTSPFVFNPSQDKPLELHGKHLTLVVEKKESYKVKIGVGECLITELKNDKIVCRPPRQKPDARGGDGDKLIIRVNVAKLSMAVGEAEYASDFNIIIVVVVLLIILVGGIFVGVFVVYYLRRKSKEEIDKMVMEMKEMEEQTKEDGKEEFADMQLTFLDLKKYIGTSGVPYHEYQKYIVKVLFQGKETAVQALLRESELSDNVRAALDSFEALLCDKHFMKSLIGTLEKQKKITMPDKAHLSALLAVVYLGRMKDYFDVVEHLLSALVEKNKKQQKVLFNRFDNITLRLLINWLSVCVFPYYLDGGASSLFVLYRAIETVVERRPADHVTGDAKNTLSQDSFLTEKVEFSAIKLLVDFDKDGKEIPCEVLDCDTISQVKHKCLRQIFMHQNKPASQMPSVEDINLEWRMGDRGKHILNDIDLTSIQDGGYIKMNTLRHYNVKDGTKIILSYKFSPDQDDSHCVPDRGSLTPPASPTSEVASTERTALLSEEDLNRLKKWHLVKEVDDDGNTLNRRNIAQVHLKEGKGLHITSLMHTKLILQEYIRAFLDNILSTDKLPRVVKYLFSTLDGLGEKSNVDQEILQCWKSECYAIRIWSILTEHPDLLFDIDKPKHVDWCLQSIRQLLLDCFHSTKITKDSSLQKLLFAAEIPEYQKKVQEFFTAMSVADPLPTNQFIDEMSSISNMQSNKLQFKKLSALQRVYKAIQSYLDDILDDLDESEETKDLDFSPKLSLIRQKMEE